MGSASGVGFHPFITAWTAAPRPSRDRKSQLWLWGAPLVRVPLPSSEQLAGPWVPAPPHSALPLLLQTHCLGNSLREETGPTEGLLKTADPFPSYCSAYVRSRYRGH